MERTEIVNILSLFLSDKNRKAEELFCRGFSENGKVNLQFDHDNKPRTDGFIIYNDPQFLEIYQNRRILITTEEYFKIPEKLSDNPWNALHIITRALSVHECLHLLYTDMSLSVARDVKCRDSKNKIYAMSVIRNIIEDSFIESYGASVYENVAVYLKLLNMAIALTEDDGDESKVAESAAKNLIDYLNYMTDFVIYSPFKTVSNNNPEIEPYIEKTKDLFIQGTLQTAPKKRYDFTRKIFDIILPLIPDDNEVLLDYLLVSHDSRIHIVRDVPIFGKNGTPKPKTPVSPVTRRLFSDLDGNHIPLSEDETAQLLLDLIFFERDKVKIDKSDDEVPEIVVSVPDDYKLANIVSHSGIKIVQKRSKSGTRYKDIYDDIIKVHQSTVNTYKSRLYDILKAKTEVVSEKLLFGHGVSSKHFGDLKKRYWYKKEQGEDFPDISFLFLIDGSGSMSGDRIFYSAAACAIMHDVLYVNNITHCVAEHRAKFTKPEVNINILCDFNAPPSQKYNIFNVEASGDNRDALALIWAEKYLSNCTNSDNRIIVIISDGVPCHVYDNYVPPLSVKDTAQNVSRIIHRGTKVIAVALDNGDSHITYDNLRQIYPHLIGCNDLKRLPKMLFDIVAKVIG